MGVGGQPSGVTIAAHSISREEIESSEDEIFGRTPRSMSPFIALHGALAAALGRLGASAGGKAAPPAGLLRIIVGPRP
jgi:hypothetical protein